MPYELGQAVRCSATYLAHQRRDYNRALTDQTIGHVTGYKSAVLVKGEWLGRVTVKWELGQFGYDVRTMRWDQIEPLM
jgi:hypothetical protein